MRRGVWERRYFESHARNRNYMPNLYVADLGRVWAEGTSRRESSVGCGVRRCRPWIDINTKGQVTSRSGCLAKY